MEQIIEFLFQVVDKVTIFFFFRTLQYLQKQSAIFLSKCQESYSPLAAFVGVPLYLSFLKLL